MLNVEFIENNEEYLHVLVTGEANIKTALKITQDAISVCIEKGKPKILIDAFSVNGTVSTLERYEYVIGIIAGYFELSKTFRSQIKIAFCGKEPLLDPHRFGETVAKNRGAKVRVFEDMEEAKTWLLEKSE